MGRMASSWKWARRATWSESKSAAEETSMRMVLVATEVGAKR
jgi:hypothetical protein